MIKYENEESEECECSHHGEFSAQSMLRRIYLIGDVEENMYGNFVTNFDMLITISNKPIYLTLNTFGGAEHLGFAIYDVLRASPCKTIVEGYGAIQSMGAIILQGATVRRVSKNCSVMIHNGLYKDMGDISSNEILRLSKEIESHNDRYYRTLAERSRLSVREIKELCFKESYFTATEAIKHGFADEILTTKHIRENIKNVDIA